MIKDILVHLDGTDDDALRIAHAAGLASGFDAYLTGLYVNLIPGDMWPVAPHFVSSLLDELQQQMRAQGERIHARLLDRMGKLDIRSEVKRLDLYQIELYNTIVIESRCRDLFIATRPYGGAAEPRWTGIFETALFHSGRAVYVLPPDAQPKELTAILIAWNGSREAARAVAEAMPFLHRAKQVHVALIEDDPAEELKLENGADLARHLSRHGISVEIRHVADWHRRSAALLNEIQHIGPDLVVMGAYGQSRFQEWVMGGVTRDFLKTCPVPMLMAR
ncbi:universal stress protein [Rhodoligotrophos ferricapiens]|uniref:universal stress protein n=1 Tax=Rhodoligotrophos ferricapiens TaxID=3069264 RepID=UPI00315DB26C